MRADFRLDEAALESHRHGLRPRVDTELGEDVLDARRDRLRADDELRRDLTLRSTFRQEAEDLALARAEARFSSRLAVPIPVRSGGAARRSERLTRARSSPASSGFDR